MAQVVATLPRDPEALIGIIVDLQDENDRLRVMLETLSRAIFGPRSERLVESDDRQMDLTLGNLSGMPAEPIVRLAPKPAWEPGTRPKARRNIGGLPRHLPREDIAIEPESDECPCCRGKLHKVGEVVPPRRETGFC
jgi:transposase